MKTENMMILSIAPELQEFMEKEFGKDKESTVSAILEASLRMLMEKRGFERR